MKPGVNGKISFFSFFFSFPSATVLRQLQWLFPTAEDKVQVPQSGIGKGGPPALRKDIVLSINILAVVCRQCVAAALCWAAPGLLLTSVFSWQRGGADGWVVLDLSVRHAVLLLCCFFFFFFYFLLFFFPGPEPVWCLSFCIAHWWSWTRRFILDIASRPIFAGDDSHKNWAGIMWASDQGTYHVA